MTDEKKEKLNKFLKNNRKWPLLIEGVSSENFSSSVIIPASISSMELGIIPTSNGQRFPLWLEELIGLMKVSKRVFVCIDRLEYLNESEQEKFYSMIKYNGINGYKFPDGTQIIIPTKKLDRISKKLSDLAIIYKVG